jgi:hypothetical protein
MEKQTMKYREHTTPMLSPESYIHLWKAASQPKPEPKVYVSRDLWRRLTTALLTGAKLLMLAACSPKPEPLAIDPLGLVWVQPEAARDERAKTLPRVEGNPFNL